MARLLHPLFSLLACATKQQLSRQVQFLKVENEILRSKLPKRITVTLQERRRLVKAGRSLGAAIKGLISIVTPATFLQWVNGTNEPKSKKKPSTRKPGRPRTPEDIRQLIVRIATETGWGFTRILGELRKLGIRISRQTVKNILTEYGLDPGPKRGPGTWDDFLKRHAATLWACDFLSVRSWTKSGLVDLYLLVFIHVGSRRVWISSATAHPDSAWVAQQARNICMDFATEAHKPTHLLLDNDTKFTKQFDAIMESEGIEVKRPIPRSPNLNAYVERVIQTIQQECLDRFLVLGERHLNYIVREYVGHYHTERPHSACGHLPPVGTGPPAEVAAPNSQQIVSRTRLGGLLRHYERRVA